MQTYFYLASYGFWSKALVSVIVKKIRKKFIPDPGGKKAPDPGSRSATLVKNLVTLSLKNHTQVLVKSVTESS
jgi:hypothetical protein